MREIKFRAWDEEAGEMMFSDQEYELCYWAFNDGKLTAAAVEEEKSGTEFEPPYMTSRELEKIMQYTGLKDKNGKEIYEGDVVRHQLFEYGRTESLVEYFGGGFFPFADADDNAPYPEPSESEVIGNIYENPELLEPVK